ncbi:hypothetical protein MYX84_01110 [Acidobacteria bacterium AH-259-O06]|nr:hypothetical protein [Acidobacteria bacterium AH-259-O06]
MKKVLKAIRYKNLDEAQRVLKEMDDAERDVLDDGGEEPQGLLAIVPEDRLPEEKFNRLFDTKKGTLVQVEKIPYPGYGPPAEERDYMGFVSENVAYVLKGCRLPVEIDNCPQGAKDIHHLEAMVMDHQHPINRDQLARKLELPPGWNFEDLFTLILEGRYTAEEIDRFIHQGIQ